MEKKLIFYCDYNADIYDFHCYSMHDYREIFIPEPFSISVTFSRNGENAPFVLERAAEPRENRRPYDLEYLKQQDMRQENFPLKVTQKKGEIPVALCEKLKRILEEREALKENEEKIVGELSNIFM